MATYFEVGNGTNWSSTGSWATSSGGASGVGPPLITDIVIFDSNSRNCTVDNASAVCVSLSFTAGTGNYASTLTFGAGNNLNVAGSVTFVAGATLSGTGTLEMSATGTLTSAGLTIPGDFDAHTTGTITLSGNAIVTGKLIYNNNAIINKTASETISANGLTMNAAGVTGTATIILTGGTWTGNANVKNSLTLQGNVTVSATVAYATGTLTYSSGTITQSSTQLNIAGSVTLDTSGLTWTTVQLNATGTLTLASALNCTTLQLRPNTVTTTMSGAFNVTCATFNTSSVTGNTTTLKLVSGQTLNITSSMSVNNGLSNSPITIQSVTGSAAAFINYSGTFANQVLAKVAFTDITASGTALYNYNGGTLTRTSGITNFDNSNILGTTATIRL